MSITKEDVKHVAKLARLKLKSQEEDVFTVQLGRIMDFIGTLKKADTSKIQTTTHVNNLANVWREDKVVEKNQTEKILQNAPQREENFFAVKKVIE
jgi:aspartyl-tRNA(Asn)/glutamyl-tRNA(Gln) amidotransferase subunit C